MAQLLVRLPEEQKLRLEDAAQGRGYTSTAELVRELIRTYLDTVPTPSR